MKTNFEIIIVGAGAVGTTLALLLAKEGLSICLVDKGSPDKITDKDYFAGRTSSLNLTSIGMLKDIGIWEELSKFSTPVKKMFIWDGEGDSNIEFQSKDIKETSLAYIVSNNAIVAELFKKFSELNNLTILTNETVKNIIQQRGNVQCRMSSKKVISGKLIIGADGISSTVRSIAKIPIRTWGYNHNAIVGSVAASKPNEKTAWQVFTSSGPLAFLPFDQANGANFSLVWSVNKERLNSILDEKKTLIATLEARSELRLGNLNILGKTLTFPLNQLHAKEYYKERVVLVGDAAHTFHPLAGQGMNLGLSDVFSLYKVICYSRRKGLDIGIDTVLTEYEQQRKKYNLRMMALMEVFKYGFASENSWIKLGRNFAFDFTKKNKEIRKLFIKAASGVI